MNNNRETIIMVDDDITNLSVAKNNLSEFYLFHTASSGEKLFQLLDRVNPSLILLDIEMPDMNGFDVIKKLKADEKTAHIPVVFLTARIDTKSEIEGLSLGAVDYIVKPFSKDLISKRIDMQIALAKENSTTAMNERLMLMLDTSPLCTQIWDNNLSLIDCNEAAVRLFGLKSKEEYAERFVVECSPKYQLDGQRSPDKIVKLVHNAFEDGYIESDWLHKMPDSDALIPTVITLVRAKYRDNYVVIGYTEDLREHYKLVERIEHRDRLLEAVNRAATLLLTTKENEDISVPIMRSMELVGRAIDVDRIQIWRSENDDEFNLVRLFDWASRPEFKIEAVIKYSNLKDWESKLANNEHIGGPVSSLSPKENKFFTSLGVKSIFLIPLFLDDQLWGMFSLDDCEHERDFTGDEIAILRSVSLMMASAINRYALVEHRTRELAEQITVRKVVEEKMRFMLERAKGLSSVLADITKSPTISGGDLKATADFIAKEGCKVLDVSRISVWSLSDNGEALLNISCYEKEIEDYLIESDFDLINREEYKNLLKSERLIVTSNVKESVEIDDGYNPVICAMLEAPIRIDGEFIGLVCADQDCCEEYSNEREWSVEEQSFVSSLSDLMALAISGYERQKARDEANDASKAKSDFLAIMSHEIRTPMNVIVGLTELLLEYDTPVENEKEYLRKINIAGNTMAGLVNDVLDISKIEAGKLDLVLGKYSIISLISDVTQLNLLHIGSKRISFEIDIDENMPAYLLGDELRVKQVLNNLLSNAFKYTHSGKVRMTLKAVDCIENKNDVILDIIVSDTGQGMNNEQIEKLFDVYSRFNQKANRKTEGTGLGMSITSNIVNAMGGKIDVKSEPGKGSVFTVQLKQERVDSEIIGKEAAANLMKFHLNSTSLKKDPIKRDLMPYGSVMVVDDVETNIFVAKGLLSPYDLKTDSATSGFEAIEKIKNGAVYDVIFMDHMMPDMDGIETTKKLRDMGYNHPVIALTANAVIGQMDLFAKSGFDDFISKPIDIKRLNNILNKFVRDKQPKEVLDSVKKPEQEKNIIAPDYNDYGLTNNKIDGIDIIRGLERYGDDEKIYISVLRSYSADVHKLLSKIETFEDDKLNSYRITVHGIKGASGDIFADEVGEMAEKLERAAEDGDIDFINNLNPIFIETAQKFLEELDNMLSSIDLDGHKPAKEKPDNKLLVLLLIKCQNYDIDGAEAVMREIDQYRYLNDEGLVEWLRDNVEMTNLTEIEKRLG